MATPLILPGYPNIPQWESRQGTILIGWYTFVLHFLVGFYFLDVYRGGSSDWILSPLFDYPQELSRSYALGLVFYSFAFMLFGSIGLIKGVEAETRIYYFPWITFTIVEIILIIQRGIYLIWRYSYDPNSTITGVVILMYAVFHIYLYHVVMSNYKYLKKIQNPTLIFPPDI